MQHNPGPAVLVTTRPVQNVHTGIDLSVPEYQEIRGKMMSGHVEYNIVVVTQLAVFKSAKHKPDDVIQFMVSKKYSEIEEFYQKLAARYPQASLPPLPRKVLFVGDSDIRERRAVFNEIMRSISKDADLATSPELLEFLGTRSTSAIDLRSKNLPDEEDDDEENEVLDFFREERTPDAIPQFKPLNNQDVKIAKEKEEDDEEDDVDPLGVMKYRKAKKPMASPVKEDKPKITIFDEEVDSDGRFGLANDFSFSDSKRRLTAKENVKLFEDPDLGGTVTLGDSLLLPTACASKEHVLSTGLEEDIEKLLSVEDFEKTWKPSPKPKPKPPPKPTVPKKPVTDTKLPILSPAQRAKPTEVKVQAMGEVDILKYIQENESIGSEESSLF